MSQLARDSSPASGLRNSNNGEESGAVTVRRRYRRAGCGEQKYADDGMTSCFRGSNIVSTLR